MSISAQINTDVFGNVTVQMRGDLNYENSIPLRKELLSLTEVHPSAQITLDMSGIDFVGSSGIGTFVDTLRQLNKKKRDKVVLSNVRPEFVKVFKLYTNYDEEILIKEFDFDTDDTFNLSQRFAGRGRTFEN